MSNKRSWLFFMMGVSTFIVENILDYQRTQPPCCDFTAEFGVPIPLGYRGGFAGVTVIFWPMVLWTTLIAGWLAVLVAFVVTKALSHINQAPGPSAPRP